jgi:hypothetical protein
MIDKAESDILAYCGDAKETNALAGTNPPTEPKPAWNWREERQRRYVTMAQRQAQNDTWVYFISDGDAIKIGRGQPDARRDGLQTGNPRNLTVLVRARSDGLDEGMLHAHFAHLRLRGEWFTPDPAIFDLIEKLKTAERDIAIGRRTISDVLHNREGIVMSRFKSPELREFEAWLRRQKFADADAKSRAACLLSNLPLLERAPDNKTVRRIIAEDIAFLRAQAAQALPA